MEVGNPQERAQAVFDSYYLVLDLKTQRKVPGLLSKASAKQFALDHATEMLDFLAELKTRWPLAVKKSIAYWKLVKMEIQKLKV